MKKANTMNFFSGSAMITQQDNRNELILSSRGGYKVGTRHKVAGPRGMPIIGNYHSPARGSGRERRVFLGGGKKEKLFFLCLFAKAHSRMGGPGTHRGSAHGGEKWLQFLL